MKSFLRTAFPVVHWVDHSGKMRQLSPFYLAHMPDEVTYLVKESDNDHSQEQQTLSICDHKYLMYFSHPGAF